MHHGRTKLLVLIVLYSGLTGVRAQTLKDIEGNVYKTVIIGNQVWMAENLKTTKYNTGDSIGTTYPATLDITSENAPEYQWFYDGNDNNLATYGRLYTWYAATDNRNICPTGWHVPTDKEWTVLTDYLISKGYGYGGKGPDISKSLAATSGWITNSLEGNVGYDQKSNNLSGFTALAGGYRYGSGSFNGSGSFGYWWSATEVNSTAAWYRSLSDHHNYVYRDSSNKQNGVSVRCIKDN